MKTQEYKSDRQKYCQDCGAVIPRVADICPRCDAPQTVFQYTQSRSLAVRTISKNRFIYGILGVAFGGLGIHRFYLGEWKIALLYLLFAWTILPTIIGFIEGVIALAQDDEQFNRKFE